MGGQQREHFGQQLVAGPVYYSVLEQGSVQGPLEPGSQQGEQGSVPVVFSGRRDFRELRRLVVRLPGLGQVLHAVSRSWVRSILAVSPWVLVPHRNENSVCCLQIVL